MISRNPAPYRGRDFYMEKKLHVGLILKSVVDSKLNLTKQMESFWRSFSLPAGAIFFKKALAFAFVFRFLPLRRIIKKSEDNSDRKNDPSVKWTPRRTYQPLISVLRYMLQFFHR